MAHTAIVESKVQNALLFIPDISGFSKFVAETEITHSRHIIQELLDLMIQGNDSGLQVSEVEGDAILFYRFGEAGSIKTLLEQVKKMFLDFHAHLKLYESQRICRCGACRSANDLQLKFIVHYGPISQHNVGSHQKLFGKDVILAHRLLKNEIDLQEYLLITEATLGAYPEEGNGLPEGWLEGGKAIQETEAGPVPFCYLPLEFLHKEVPEPEVADFSQPGSRWHIGMAEGLVEAPMELVFNVLADLPFRNQWQDGLDPDWAIDQLNSRITRVGSTHRCLYNGPVMTTHGFEKGDHMVRMTDTDRKFGISMVLTLERISPAKSNMRIDIFQTGNIFNKLLVRLFFKRKMHKSALKSISNLNDFCRQLVASGKNHSASFSF
jgi:hypothetical protein